MKTRIYVTGVLGGLAVLLVLAVVVVQFGRNNPSPPSLIENPNPAIPGELLYQNEDGCIMRAAASGASREEVWCTGERFGGGGVTWVDSDTIAYVSHEKGRGALYEVDLNTREERVSSSVVTGPQYGPGGPRGPDGETITVDQDGTVHLVKGGTRTEIADFDGTGHNFPNATLWSPDGQWILLQYYPPRGNNGYELWVLSRDGKTSGTIAKDVQGFGTSWRIDGVGITPAPADFAGR